MIYHYDGDNHLSFTPVAFHPLYQTLFNLVSKLFRSFRYLVGSIDQESSQQLQMWFSEHFFAPKLTGLIVTPIVSATVEQKWREKMSEKHIPFDF